MFLSAVLLSTSFAVAAAQSPITQRFDPARDPQRDLWAATDEARAQHKRILLDIGGEWCGWCRLLDRTIAGDLQLSEFVTSHFVIVKVNFSEENPNKEFLSCFPFIFAYPHLFVLDSDGRLLHSQMTDVFETGGQLDAKRLLEFFQRWAK